MDVIEIATAFVAIRPQTDGFESELASALAGGDPVEVPVIAETGDAEAQIDAISDDQLSLFVEADTGDAEAAIDGLDGADVDVKVTADTDQAQQSVEDLSGSVGDLMSNIGGAGGDGASGMLDGFIGALGGAGLAGGTAAAGGIAALAVGVADVTQSFGEAQAVAAETDSMLASLGDGAVTSSDHIASLSQAIMEYSGFSDEAIQTGANTLLMFDNINSQPVFDRALNDATDLARRLGTDVPGAARMLGMALQDPEAGMNRLRRAGVTLNESQQATVEAMMATGDVAGAQEVIFDALEGKIGDLAEAYGRTLPGQIDRTNEKIDEQKEKIGEDLGPWYARALEGASNVITGLTSGTDEMIRGMSGGSEATAEVGKAFGDLAFDGQSAAASMYDVAGAADGAGQSISHLGDRVQAYLDGTFRIPDAERELRDSLAAVSDVFADSSHTADDVAAAMEGVAYATAGVGTATGDMGGAVDVAKFGLMAMAAEAGLSEDQMADLARVLDNIPGQVTVPVTTPGGAEAENQATRIGDALLGIPQTSAPRFSTPGAPAAESQISRIGNALLGIPQNVDINLRVNTGSLYADVAGAAAALHSLKQAGESGAALGRPLDTGGGGGTIVVQTRLDGAVIAESVHRHNGYALVSEGYEP